MISKNSDSAKITIGITCYNAADTIKNAIEGALCQNWPNVEIIIVDDCSSDHSVEVIKEVSKKYDEKKIHLIRHKINKGYPAALNTICRNATGDFIAIFDDDDRSNGNRLKRQYDRITAYEKLHSNTALTLCYSNRGVILPGENKSDHTAFAIGHTSPEPHGGMVADYILCHIGDARYCWGIFGSCTLMARRQVFETVGPFDETFRRCAEWDFAIRAAFRKAHFISVDENLVIQQKTITSDKAGKIPEEYQVKLRKKYKEYLKEKGAYLSSHFIARSGRRKNFIRYYLCMLFSAFLSPNLILPAKIKTLRQKLFNKSC